MLPKADIFYGQGEYINQNISDKLSGIDVGLKYALSERTEIKGSYRFEHQDSNSADREYSRNVFTLGFTIHF